MKLFGVAGTTLLFLLMGAGTVVYAQDQHEDAKPQAQEEEKPKDEARPAKPDHPEAKDRQEMKDENERKQEERNDANKEREQNDHHMQAAENRNEHGGRIPDDKFRAHFGREHRFRVGRPTVVAGRPQFVYGGYTFVMVNPWPTGWGYDDEVYVDYIDGVYYLIDPFHPGVQIVVNVVF